MPKTTHNRKVERIRLFPSLEGTINQDSAAEVEELSLHGARLRHYREFPLLTPIELSFAWKQKGIDVQCEIVRTHVEQFGPSHAIYHSGVRFLSSMGPSIFNILQLLTEYVEEVLERQVANASGSDVLHRDHETISRLLPDAEDRAHLRVKAARDEGYASYIYENGAWHRTLTWESAQPDNGFTIWRFEENDEVEELCRIYESGDAHSRAMIRMCAELSLISDDSLPPQTFGL